MDRGVGAAARLPESECSDLAIQALARSETVSDLAARHRVSHKFVYQHTHKASAALDDAFSLAAPDDEVLFELAVTKAWLRQVIVGLTLICRSSYRSVVEFLRDLLGVPVSVGCVHNVLQAATQEASAVIATFAEKYGAKYEKAVACLTRDQNALLAFYDFLAEHWDHLRTSNPIESVFATVRHRTVRTKGALSQDSARLMVFKLVMAAARTWRRLKGENQLPKVVQGVTFRNGVEVTETPAQNAA
jgi:hypothetical protein